MTRILVAFGVAAAITISTALVQGRYVNRWGVPADLSQAAERLEQFPAQLGEWSVVGEGEPLAASVINELGVNAYVSRVYQNPSNGERVSMLLMVGTPGRLLRHPPTVCYANQANRQIGETWLLPLGEEGAQGELRVVEYEKGSEGARERFFVAFGLSDDGRWQMPASPRVRFGGSSVLYKVQVLSLASGRNDYEATPGKTPPSLANFASKLAEQFAPFGSTE